MSEGSSSSEAKTTEERIEEAEKEVKELTGEEMTTQGQWSAKIAKSTYWDTKHWEVKVNGNSFTWTKGWATEIVAAGENLVILGEMFNFFGPARVFFKVGGVVEVSVWEAKVRPAKWGINMEEVWLEGLRDEIAATDQSIRGEHAAIRAERNRIAAEVTQLTMQKTALIAVRQAEIANKVRTIAQKTEAVEARQAAIANQIRTAGQHVAAVEEDVATVGNSIIDAGMINETLASRTEQAASHLANVGLATIDSAIQDYNAAVAELA